MAWIETKTPVLRYHHYMGRGSQSVYGTRYFCGSCRRCIGGAYGSACYGYPEYPEDIEDKNETPYGLGSWDHDKSELEYYSFCPWCGVRFVDEWWKDRTVQNERVIDHYQNPGTHKGDTHEFRGDGPGCMANHWLAVSGGDKLCWCEPEVEAGLMGCVIRHQDKRYEDVMALHRELESDEDAEL